MNFHQYLATTVMQDLASYLHELGHEFIQLASNSSYRDNAISDGKKQSNYR